MFHVNVRPNSTELWIVSFRHDNMHTHHSSLKHSPWLLVIHPTEIWLSLVYFFSPPQISKGAPKLLILQPASLPMSSLLAFLYSPLDEEMRSGCPPGSPNLNSPDRDGWNEHSLHYSALQPKQILIFIYLNILPNMYCVLIEVLCSLMNPK